jgi:hypothetical protein
VVANALADPRLQRQFADLGLEIPTPDKQTPGALLALQRMEIGVFVESSGRFLGLMLEKAVHCLGILHYGWAWNLAPMTSIPTITA